MQDVIRDGHGRFLPGTASPYPAGRPALPAELRTLARAETRACLQKLVELRDDPEVPAAVQLAATNALLDRAWGRPETRINAQIEKRSVEDFSDEELMVVIGSASPGLEAEGLPGRSLEVTTLALSDIDFAVDS